MILQRLKWWSKKKVEVGSRNQNKREDIFSMIRIIEIREEEVEHKDLEEEASMGNFFIMEKKGIEHLNVPST